MEKPAVELVFHAPVAGGTPSSAFADAVATILKASDSELRVVSPYLGAEVLTASLRGRAFRLVTDLEACFDTGVDNRVREVLANHRGCSRHLPNVHAKTLFNDAAALVGSANFTTQGFACRDELGCLIRESSLLASLCEWFEAVWRSSHEVTPELLEAYVTRGHNRPELLRNLAQQAGPARSMIKPHAPRTLGWMRASDGAAMRADPALPPGITADECDELAETLRQRTRSREEATRILGLFSEALAVASLALDDERLHLNFGASTRWAINVTVAKRSIAWLDERAWSFGLLVDDHELAEQLAERHQPHVASFLFRRPDTPALRVEFDLLEPVLQEVRDNWHRAIRLEVARTTKDGKPYTNAYRRHNRAFLYDAVTDPALRERVVNLAFRSRSWWLGVNNGGGRGHIQLKELAPFLNGAQREFEWPIGHSKPKKLYGVMRQGDRVLVWTGHGQEPQWGLLGTADITEVREDAVLLGDPKRFARPLTPYPKGDPSETDEVAFLREHFGEAFAPLGDVWRAVYGTARRPPITVAEVPKEVFDAVVARARA